MIGHTFLALLFPLLITLFYFFTAHSRRQPISVLRVNVIAVILTFAAGVMIDALAIHSILYPLSSWPSSANIAIGIIGAFWSIPADLILLIHLIPVHPLSHVGLPRVALLTTLQILLEIAPIVNLIIFIKILAVAARGRLSNSNGADMSAQLPAINAIRHRPTNSPTPLEQRCADPAAASSSITTAQQWQQRPHSQR